MMMICVELLATWTVLPKLWNNNTKINICKKTSNKNKSHTGMALSTVYDDESCLCFCRRFLRKSRNLTCRIAN